MSVMFTQQLGVLMGGLGTSACTFEDEVHCGWSETSLQHLALESSADERRVFPPYGEDTVAVIW